MRDIESEISESRSLYEADMTWGSSACSGDVEARLDILTHIQKLPAGAVVLNLGAGIFLDVDATMHIARPDLTLVQVDAGYRHDLDMEEFDDIITDVIEPYNPSEQDVLTDSDTWFDKRVAGIVERLPIKSASVDFILSHALIPEHLPVDAHEFVLAEMSRVLKPGALAVLGPYNLFHKQVWEQNVAAALMAGQFIECITEEKPIRLGEYNVTTGGVTELIR